MCVCTFFHIFSLSLGVCFALCHLFFSSLSSFSVYCRLVWQCLFIIIILLLSLLLSLLLANLIAFHCSALLPWLCTHGIAHRSATSNPTKERKSESTNKHSFIHSIPSLFLVTFILSLRLSPTTWTLSLQTHPNETRPSKSDTNKSHFISTRVG